MDEGPDSDGSNLGPPSLEGSYPGSGIPQASGRLESELKSCMGAGCTSDYESSSDCSMYLSGGAGVNAGPVRILPTTSPEMCNDDNQAGTSSVGSPYSIQKTDSAADFDFDDSQSDASTDAYKSDTDALVAPVRESFRRWRKSSESKDGDPNRPVKSAAIVRKRIRETGLSSGVSRAPGSSGRLIATSKLIDDHAMDEWSRALLARSHSLPLSLHVSTGYETMQSNLVPTAESQISPGNQLCSPRGHTRLSSNNSGRCSSSPRPPSRIDQIKIEESVSALNDRELLLERDMQTTASLTSSWEDLSLEGAGSSSTCSPRKRGFALTQSAVNTLPPAPPGMDKKGIGRLSEPITISCGSICSVGSVGQATPPSCGPAGVQSPYSLPGNCQYPAACSPSPTRPLKQCFSPSLQMPINTSCPSPTSRRTLVPRRSQSPILRPSSLNLKRKPSVDFEYDQFSATPCKRPHCESPTSSICSNNSSNPTSPTHCPASPGRPPSILSPLITLQNNEFPYLVQPVGFQTTLIRPQPTQQLPSLPAGHAADQRFSLINSQSVLANPEADSSGPQRMQQSTSAVAALPENEEGSSTLGSLLPQSAGTAPSAATAAGAEKEEEQKMEG